MEALLIKRALLSVTHKEGLIELAQVLVANGVELISTGGTYKTLEQAGLPVKAVSQVTKFPEIMGGRVKTLHPNIHGGILADKDNPEHLATLAELGINTIDLVCVNLYDFASAVAGNYGVREAVEQIDIGGPCMLRASAKNFHSVVVLPEVAAYGEFIQEFKSREGYVGLKFRHKMAKRTFDLTSNYDRMISDYL